MKKNKSASGKFNTHFYKLRADRDWSQEQMAIHLDCTRPYINHIENGISQGTVEFWSKVQRVFDIPNEDMWQLIWGKKEASHSPTVHYVSAEAPNIKDKDVVVYTNDISQARNFDFDGYSAYWEKND